MLGEQPMENAIKTNRLSIVSFVSGLIALLSLGIFWGLLYFALPSSAGYPAGPANRAIAAIMDLTAPLRNLCALTALVTGIFALIEIKKKGSIERGKTFAWTGIALGAGWILFSLLTGITFFLAEIIH